MGHRRIVAPLLASALLVSCGFDSSVSERLLLSVTSEVAVDSLDVRVARDGRVDRVATITLSAEDDLTSTPHAIDLGGLLDGTNALDMQVGGLMAGTLVAVYNGQVSPPAGGVVTVHLSAVGTECDIDGDGTLDCSVAGCCAGVPDDFSDCAPSDEGAGPGATEVCDGDDNDCDGQIDEGVCVRDVDAFVDVSLVDTPLSDTPLSDTPPVDVGPDVLCPEGRSGQCGSAIKGDRYGFLRGCDFRFQASIGAIPGPWRGFLPNGAGALVAPTCREKDTLS